MRLAVRTLAAAAAACAAAVVALVLGGPPALAKGIASVTIDGPGLAGPIELSTDAGVGAGGVVLYDDAGREVDLIDELDPWVAMRGTTAEVLPAAPTDDLGPAYVVSWRLYGLTSPVDQDLYPFAAGGPLVHFSAYETRGYGTGDAWYRAPDSTLATLADIGAIAGDRSGPKPERRVDAAAVPPVSTASEASESRSASSPGLGLVAGVMAAAGLVTIGGAVVVRRSRDRRRRVAPIPL